MIMDLKSMYTFNDAVKIIWFVYLKLLLQDDVGVL